MPPSAVAPKDSQAGMPGASQVLLCLGLDVLFQDMFRMGPNCLHEFLYQELCVGFVSVCPI